MAVLNTTSPTAVPGAPMERPRNTDPSARTSAAVSDVDVIFRSGYEKRERLSPLPLNWRRDYTHPAIPSQLLHVEDVEHVVETGGPPAQPFRGPHGAACVGRAALRAHRQLQALAGAGEERR